MSFNANTSLSNSQKVATQTRQTITGAQIESLKILSSTTTELSEIINKAVLENPFLEKPEPTEFPADRSSGSTSTLSDGKLQNWIEQVPDREQSFEVAMVAQISQLNLSTIDQAIAQTLLGGLDATGIYRGDILSKVPDCLRGQIETVLHRLQTLEPTGVFACSIEQCFTLQLKASGCLSDTIKAMLNNSDMIAKGDVEGLMQTCGITKEELEFNLSLLKALNPRPAEQIERSLSPAVVPEVIVSPISETEWLIELDTRTQHKLLTNKSYFEVVSAGTLSKPDKKYLKDNWRIANWLVKTLERRAETILKICGSIVEHQSTYLRGDQAWINPLTMKEVAEQADVHESTVSRTVNNKFIQTPLGTLEMRHFFQAGFGGESGAPTCSRDKLRTRIKALVGAEKKPLSDSAIVLALLECDIVIARRTVAKYRQELGIKASFARNGLVTI